MLLVALLLEVTPAGLMNKQKNKQMYIDVSS